MGVSFFNAYVNLKDNSINSNNYNNENCSYGILIDS